MFFKYVLSFTLLSTMLFASIGKFTAVNGDVNLLRNHKSMKVFSMLEIEKKDIISTSNDGFAKIIFNDKTAITLGKNTNFKVEDYFFDSTKKSKSNFKVTSGFFKVITGKISKVARKRFKLKTRNATIGIRGTIFEGTTDENGDYIGCDKGAINVCASGECKVVEAGKYTVVKTGKVPMDAQESKKSDSNQQNTGAETHNNGGTNGDSGGQGNATETKNTGDSSTSESHTNKNQTDTTDKIAKAVKLQEYLNLLLVAQGAVVDAVMAANDANEAFNRIIEAKDNVSAYEISAYEAAQAAADSAAQAAQSAQREAAAAAEAASSETASQSAQTAADDIHQMKIEVTNIKDLAADQIDIVNTESGISVQKTDELHTITQKMEEGDFSATNGDVLSQEAVTAKEQTVVANQSVQDYKNQAVEIEGNALARLQDAQDAQTSASEHATAAESAAVAAEQARAAAAEQARAAAAAAAAADQGGQISTLQ